MPRRQSWASPGKRQMNMKRMRPVVLSYFASCHQVSGTSPPLQAKARTVRGAAVGERGRQCGQGAPALGHHVAHRTALLCGRRLHTCTVRIVCSCSQPRSWSSRADVHAICKPQRYHAIKLKLKRLTRFCRIAPEPVIKSATHCKLRSHTVRAATPTACALSQPCDEAAAATRARVYATTTRHGQALALNPEREGPGRLRAPQGLHDIAEQHLSTTKLCGPTKLPSRC